MRTDPLTDGGENLPGQDKHSIQYGAVGVDTGHGLQWSAATEAKNGAWMTAG